MHGQHGYILITVIQMYIDKELYGRMYVSLVY